MTVLSPRGSGGAGGGAHPKSTEEEASEGTSALQSVGSYLVMNIGITVCNKALLNRWDQAQACPVPTPFLWRLGLCGAHS